MSLEEASQRLGAPSPDWLARQLRAQKLPGRKVGRSWRMTEGDIATAIALLATGPRPAVQAPQSANPAGLTAGSRKRLERRNSR
ncbi:hypothetical protein [Nocardia sp. BMG51109]|uniref:hypothetical protein n=1 Tax=Nocardia sp. BMG51109 TaxID=1056816 RepID=UPI00055FFBD5|nr:hypothetical protein [Nocardia sp. BMG51109]